MARGYPEVMLLGQTVNAYRHADLDFAGLLARVSAVAGLRRLRFTTSHPSHVTVRLAEALTLPRLCPYIHLPVQSGSDRILASMRRGYTRDEYLDIVGQLRSRVPGLALSSDAIVGYPGETDSDFEATLRLVDAVGFDGLFVFMYSPRPGTGALRLRTKNRRGKEAPLPGPETAASAGKPRPTRLESVAPGGWRHDHGGRGVCGAVERTSGSPRRRLRTTHDAED